MTNKEKTILFLKALCLLFWVGAAVVTCVAVLNGDASNFTKFNAAILLVFNLGLAGKFGFEQIIK